MCWQESKAHGKPPLRVCISSGWARPAQGGGGATLREDGWGGGAGVATDQETPAALLRLQEVSLGAREEFLDPSRVCAVQEPNKHV